MHYEFPGYRSRLPVIYLLGGTGYIGLAFQKYLKSHRIGYKVLSRREYDYTDRNILAELLKNDKPDFLINAAGYTGRPNIDACESDRAECLFGNAILPGRIAQACRGAGIAWGHVSTGCIYTGKRPDGKGFTEEDIPNFTFRQNNCSFYSGTKGLGEEVLEGMPDVYLWRLRLPFNHIDNSRNYLSKLIRYEYHLDTTNSISQLDEFVAAAVACWEQKIPFGIYNMINPGQVTTHEVVELIRESKVSTKEFKFFESEADFMSKAAKAPRSNCVLSSDKLSNAGIKMRPIRDAIRDALDRWQNA